MAQDKYPRLVNAGQHLRFFFAGNPGVNPLHLKYPTDKGQPMNGLLARAPESYRMAYAKRATSITGAALTSATATMGGLIQFGYLSGIAAAAKPFVPSLVLGSTLNPVALALLILAGSAAALTLAVLGVMAIVSARQAHKSGTTYHSRATTLALAPSSTSPNVVRSV